MTRDRHFTRESWKAQKLTERVGRSNWQIHRPNSSGKAVPRLLHRHRQHAAGPHKGQAQYGVQHVSSRQKLQEELGQLLIYLVKSRCDDEREEYLWFIESTLRRYIRLG